MNRNIIISRDMLFAYFFLLLISIRNSLVNTELQVFGTAERGLVLAETLVFGIYLLAKKKHSAKYIFLLCLFALIAVITLYKTGFMNLYSMLMVAIVFTNLDYSAAFKFLFRVRLGMLLIIVTLSLVGIIDINQRYVSKSMVINSDLGYGLGYTHPNRLAYAFLLLIILYILQNYQTVTITTYLYSVILLTSGYFITKSRTLVVCAVILLVTVFFFNTDSFIQGKKKMVNMLSLSAIPFCVAFGVVIPMFMYSMPTKIQEILLKIDVLLSGRFTHAYRAFLTYPITLFGGRDEFSQMQEIYNYSTVDNGYVRLVFSLGVFGFAVYSTLTICSLFKLIKNQQYVFVAVIITISIWGISENILSSFAFNILVAFWCELLKKRKNQDAVKHKK